MTIKARENASCCLMDTFIIPVNHKMDVNSHVYIKQSVFTHKGLFFPFPLFFLVLLVVNLSHVSAADE